MADTALEPSRPTRKIRPIRIDGDVAYVPLTRGLEAVIDAADVPLVEGWNWYACVGKYGHAYAYRAIKRDGKHRSAPMHRQIMGPSERLVDHIDGDGLNNRRSNLRLATPQQNIVNRVMDRRNKLGIKGVDISNGKYRACIQKDGRTIFLGRYETAKEASAAYNGAAKALFGEFARSG